MRVNLHFRKVHKKQWNNDNVSAKYAALYPGRWNKSGTPVIYTGESIEIALLETLVHIPSMIIPQMDILTIEIPDDSIKEFKIGELPPNWRQYPAPSILRSVF